MSDAEAAVSRLRAAFDLYEAGVALMRARLTRENAELSEAEIDERLQDWLLTRPGAEFGDGEGVPGTWPRRHEPR